MSKSSVKTHQKSGGAFDITLGGIFFSAPPLQIGSSTKRLRLREGASISLTEMVHSDRRFLLDFLFAEEEVYFGTNGPYFSTHRFLLPLCLVDFSLARSQIVRASSTSRTKLPENHNTRLLYFRPPSCVCIPP